ncbi:hypothetical protein ACFQH6_05145 [Halobacteriaceae archaeon GCM10025711]
MGNVRHVNEDVERRADAALARVERLEAAVDDAPGSDPPPEPPTDSDSGTGDWLSDPVTEHTSRGGTGTDDAPSPDHRPDDDRRGLLARVADWL